MAFSGMTNYCRQFLVFYYCIYKQYNKMLKIRSEMLKIMNNVKMIKLEKISRKIFPGISRIPGIPNISEDFRNTGNSPGIFAVLRDESPSRDANIV